MLLPLLSVSFSLSGRFLLLGISLALMQLQRRGLCFVCLWVLLVVFFLVFSVLLLVLILTLLVLMKRVVKMRFRRGLFVLLCLFVFCVSFCFASGDSLSGSDEPSGDSLYAGEEVITTYSVLSPITPDNTSGLVSVVVSLIGNYNPIVAEHRYQNTNGTWSYVREIQPDFTWIISAAIFALVLYCVFRLWGAFFCRK